MPNTELDLAHISTGLSSSQVIRRLEEEGFNELPTSKSSPWLKLLWEIFKDPTVTIIIVCGVIYFFMGDPQEAFLLLFSLIVIMIITLAQERKAERALETLKQLSSPRALVLRDGNKVRIPGRDIVREDILLLQEGDRIPADAIILEGDHIETDESMLTGESLSVQKKRSEYVYAGTTIVKGQGVAKVTQTGLHTEMGKIGGALKKAKRSLSPLEAETRILVKKLNWLALAMCIIVILVNSWYRGNWIQSFLVGLTLAMAILPNELPAVTTIFLALGAWRMSKKRVLTRHLPAIENLGAVTVLCVDKTGTLTLNKMSIQMIHTQGRDIDFSDPSLAELPAEFHEIIEYGILASQQDPFDPMEIAFHSAGKKYLSGSNYDHEDWEIFKEYPLSPELLSLSHVWKSEDQDGFIVSAKGAPEAIIDLCHMNSEESEKYHLKAQEMAKNGLRVLGVAKATHQSELPNHQHDFEFQFIGLVGIADPVRPEVPEAIQSCLKAGIRVVMITGDHPVTASSIAKKIGLPDPEKVLRGSDIASLSAEDLKSAILKTAIFSRVKPEQKLLIVENLKACGEIVAMTGDGVNDAPALKSAHIGVAMGGRGTDVARESASLVILDDDFGSLVEAVKMGRRVYQNLKNAMIYLSSVHIPIAGMSMLPVLFDLPLILLPAHIAFLHLIIEPASSIVFEVDKAPPQMMLRPPRNLKESILSRRMWLPIIIKGTSSFIALSLIYLISLKRGQGESDARSLVFLTLMFSNMALILLSRNNHLPFIKRFSFAKNSAAKWLIISTTLLIVLVFSFEATRTLFKFSQIHLHDILICLLIGIASVTWVQLIPSPKEKI